MERVYAVAERLGHLFETFGLFLFCAKFGGAIAGSAISIAFLLPKNRREAALRLCVGFLCGLVFGGTVGVKLADWLGLIGQIEPDEIALVGATLASLCAWWGMGALERVIGSWSPFSARSEDRKKRS
jgi:hypothetical protein